jgi:hypothetical protein
MEGRLVSAQVGAEQVDLRALLLDRCDRAVRDGWVIGDRMWGVEFDHGVWAGSGNREPGCGCPLAAVLVVDQPPPVCLNAKLTAADHLGVEEDWVDCFLDGFDGYSEVGIGPREKGQGLARALGISSLLVPFLGGDRHDLEAAFELGRELRERYLPARAA